MSWSTRLWSGSPALWLTTTPNCSLENRPRNWAGPDRSRDCTPSGESAMGCFEDWMVRFHWPWAQSIAYATGHKFRIITFFYGFFKVQGCVDLVKHTVILWNIITILNVFFIWIYIVKCNLFLWWKLYFQHHYSSLQCHMIFRNQSKMMIWCSILFFFIFIE